MVGVARFELATPAMSTQCSTTELYAHAGERLATARHSFKPISVRHSFLWQTAVQPQAQDRASERVWIEL